MSWFQLALLLLAVALFSWFAVGQLKNILTRLQIVDRPNDRTLHQGAIPRGGGLVIAVVLIVSLLALGYISDRLQMLGAVGLIILCWALLSWWDDRHQLSASVRVLIQGGLSVLIILAFGYVDVIQVSQTNAVALGLSGAAITWVGMMWFTNMYNFMDGMDGLAASQSIIGAVTISFWLWNFGDQSLALTCMLLASACYGFIIWNWYPAKIFLGDVGSITLGAFFSILIIIGSHRYAFPVLSFVLLFGVFVFDASLTVMRRIVRREKFWLPHRSHYYQRLAQQGLAHDRIVIGLIVLMLICSLLATISLQYRDIIWLCVVAELVLLSVAAFAVSRLENKIGRAPE